MSVNGEDLIKSWAEDWASGNFVHLLTLFTEDCVYEDVAFGMVHRGKVELKSFAEITHAAFADFNFKVNNCFATENFGSAEWTFSGTHHGDLPGMPATNKSFTFRDTSVFEFNSGKIQRCSDYWNQTTLLKQLGLMSSD